MTEPPQMLSRQLMTWSATVGVVVALRMSCTVWQSGSEAGLKEGTSIGPGLDGDGTRTSLGHVRDLENQRLKRLFGQRLLEWCGLRGLLGFGGLGRAVGC
ncbi:hypothetical protein ABZS59_31755 [Streptomyces flaveolus]|uniref:hypothetical protein n=1 Tax=Streptomyces flaveolus TaxID=67297 RepID=UPI0033B0B38A